MTTVLLKGIGANNFKNHKGLRISFPLDMDLEIKGKNGVGKTTVAEIITWTFYGVDMLGNTMNKKLSPEPTTYEWDRLTTNVLIEVDGVDVMLGKKLEAGTTTCYINDIEKTATDYKAFVTELFNQKEFMSIFSPQFFFTQTYQEQRAQVSKYVTTAAEKDILAKLPKTQATPLKAALKKGKLDEVEKTNKNKKKDADLDLTKAKERLKTLLEQQHEAGGVQDIEALKAESEKLQQQITETNEIAKRNAKLESDRAALAKKRDAAQAETRAIKHEHDHVKLQELDSTCPTCQQALTDAIKQDAQVRRDQKVDELAAKFKPTKEEFLRLCDEYNALPAPEPQLDVYELMSRKSVVDASIKAASQAQGLDEKIKAAEEAVTNADKEFKAAQVILDGVVEYRKVEGELNVAKMDGMFPGLTISHFTENIGNGEKKPDFEFCMDGKPYRKLSYGEKIKAGLLFVRGMIEASNMRLPVFHDNAESLTSDFELNTQVIICYAKKGQDEIEFTPIKKAEVFN